MNNKENPQVNEGLSFGWKAFWTMVGVGFLAYMFMGDYTITNHETGEVCTFSIPFGNLECETVEQAPQLDSSCQWDPNITDFRCGKDQIPVHNTEPTNNSEPTYYETQSWEGGKRSLEIVISNVESTVPTNKNITMHCGENDFRDTATRLAQELLHSSEDGDPRIYGYNPEEFFKLCESGEITISE